LASVRPSVRLSYTATRDIRADTKYFLPLSVRYSVIADGRRSCKSCRPNTYLNRRQPVTSPQRQLARPTRPRWGVTPLAFQLCPTETFAVANVACSVESLVSRQKFGW